MLVTLDCGGNPVDWYEAIFQVEDLAPEGAQAYMTAGNFRSIMKAVASEVSLVATARLIFEVGPPEVPRQVLGVGSLRLVTHCA